MNYALRKVKIHINYGNYEITVTMRKDRNKIMQKYPKSVMQ